jgi:hypothetical protein
MNHSFNPNVNTTMGDFPDDDHRVANLSPSYDDVVNIIGRPTIECPRYRMLRPIRHIQIVGTRVIVLSDTKNEGANMNCHSSNNTTTMDHHDIDQFPWCHLPWHRYNAIPSVPRSYTIYPPLHYITLH